MSTIRPPSLIKLVLFALFLAMLPVVLLMLLCGANLNSSGARTSAPDVNADGLIGEGDGAEGVDVGLRSNGADSSQPVSVKGCDSQAGEALSCDGD